MKVIRDAVPQTADASDAAWDKSIGKYRCSECLEEVPAVTRIYVRHDLAGFRLCDRCISELRKLLSPTSRRALSARSLRALSFLAQTPRQRGSWHDVRAATGSYATNALKALIAQGLIDESVSNGVHWLELTAYGRERLRA